MMPSSNSYVSWHDVGVMPPVARVLEGPTSALRFNYYRRVLSVSAASLAPRDPKRLRGFRWFQRVLVVGFSGRVSSVGFSGFEWVSVGFGGLRWVVLVLGCAGGLWCWVVVGFRPPRLVDVPLNAQRH